jgi:hypothetical protein
MIKKDLVMLIKFIKAIGFFLLAVAVPATASPAVQTSVVASDGVTYQIAPEVPTNTRTLTPGQEVVTIESDCNYRSSSLFYREQICSGSETIVATTKGEVQKVTTEATTEKQFKLELLFGALAMLLMAGAMWGNRKGNDNAVAVAFAFAVVVAAAFAYAAAVAAAVVFAAFAAAVAVAVSALADSFYKKEFLVLAVVFQVLMVVATALVLFGT